MFYMNQNIGKSCYPESDPYEVYNTWEAQYIFYVFGIVVVVAVKSFRDKAPHSKFVTDMTM
jgi:hypothetical protein